MAKSKTKPSKPGRVIITCMDYRVKESVILQNMQWDNAYVIRNAGGSVTQDVIRSLLLLQKFVLEGTYNIDILVVAHTDCGMKTADGAEDKLRRDIEVDPFICETPPFALEAFPSPELAVRRSIQRLRTSRFVSSRTPEGLRIWGQVYDVIRKPNRLFGVKTHVVLAGQDWDTVARLHNTTVGILQSANPQAFVGALGTDQVLYIP